MYINVYMYNIYAFDVNIYMTYIFYCSTPNNRIVVF